MSAPRLDAPIPLPLPAPKRFGRATDLIEECAIIGYAASRAVLAEPIEEVWAGIFGPAHHVEMVGPSYTGKSGLAIGIAVAMANPTGKPIKLLGRVVTPMPEGKLALVVNEENARQSAVATIDRWIEMLGLPIEATWDRICLLPRQGVQAKPITQAEVDRPTGNDVWSNLVHALVHGAFGIAIFDTRARIFRGFGDPNSEEAQAAVSNIITTIIEAAECPIIVISHTRKGAKGDDIEDISGSAQRGGGADVVIMVTAARSSGRVTSSKVVYLKVRDGIDEHPAPVRFTTEKTAKGWRLALTETEEESSAPMHERVHRLLCDAQGELSANEIRKSLGQNHKTISDAIGTLKKSKRIKCRKTTKNGAECWVFSAVRDFGDLFGRPDDV